MRFQFILAPALIITAATCSFVPVFADPASSVKASQLQAGATFKDCDECPEMVVVPAGAFMQGATKADKWYSNAELPRQTAEISAPFAVGIYEVTLAQFRAFVKDTGHEAGKKCLTFEKGKWSNRAGKSFEDPGFEQTDKHPATCLAWDDAKAYVSWLAKKTGKPYRLLTETEWEYAARANTETPFWWGASITTDQANYDGQFTFNGPKGEQRQKTVPVDSFKPNGFGLYNVHGNVSEWVEDCWHDNYKGAPLNGSAWLGDEAFCFYKVLRGGSWNYQPNKLRSATRERTHPENRNNSFGLRVARDLD